MVTREQVFAALNRYSIEVTPASADRVDSFRALLPPGTRVSVTWLPGADSADTVRVAARLAGEGMVAVPHLAARSLRDHDHLDRWLGALADRAGVTQLLVIAGGLARPLGPYGDSMAVLESGLLQRHGITRIGLAGHPEGSPDIGDAALARALAAKNRWAERTGIETGLVTQFCFDAAAVLAWERRIRRAGNRLSVRIGVPGPATLKTLLRFAIMSGAGPSMRMLRRQAGNLAALLAVQAPDRLIAGIAAGMDGDPDCRIDGLHFYPFGGIARTAGWLNTVLANQFDCHEDGFTVWPPETLRRAS